MAKLGSVSWQDVDKVLLANGWQYKRTKGSHRSYTKTGYQRPVIVPKHDEIAKGTLSAIIRQSGLIRSDFT